MFVGLNAGDDRRIWARQSRETEASVEALMNSDQEIYASIRALSAQRDTNGVLLFGDSLKRGAENPAPRFTMAIAHALVVSGEPRQAIDWFGRIAPADKPYEAARSQMARLYNSLGEFDKALSTTDQFDAGATTEAMLVARARALIGLKRETDAVRFVRLVAAKREPGAALLEAGADAAADALDWAASLQFVECAMAVSGERRLRFRQAVFLYHLERFTEALLVLEECRDDEELAVRALSYIARIHQRAGDGAALQPVCESLLVRDPRNAFAFESLIRHFLELREFDQAKAWFDKAHHALPDRFPEAIYTFMFYERQTRLSLALKPFYNGQLDEKLTEGMRERIATTCYFAARFGHAHRFAKLMEDPERSILVKAKVALAMSADARVGRLPDIDEGRVLRALAYYRAGSFASCVAELKATRFGGASRLAIRNFIHLAEAERRLPNELFAPSTTVATPTDPPLIIQQLWVGSELSYIEHLSIRSFVACGHQTHLYTYDENISVPRGCIVKDAREILPESEIFAHSAKTGRSSGSLAGFADLFRLKLVHQLGGGWADCDVVCLEPIRARAIVSTEIARAGTIMLPAVTNCFFAAPQGEHGLLKAFEQAAKSDRTELLWGEIGIHKMAEIVAEEGWGDRLTDPSDICPIPSFRIVDAILAAIDPREIVETTKCRAVHLYNEVMRMVGMDKNGTFPPQGLIGYLEQRVAAREREVSDAPSLCEWSQR